MLNKQQFDHVLTDVFKDEVLFSDELLVDCRFEDVEKIDALKIAKIVKHYHYECDNFITYLGQLYILASFPLTEICQKFYEIDIENSNEVEAIEIVSSILFRV